MIICFTGTGNSGAVASLLSRIIPGEKVVMLRDEILREAEPQLSDPGERVIWVFPTYSWGVPPVVAGFISRVTIDGGDAVSHFMVTTCGDDVGETDRQWKHLVERRGWDAAGCWSVQMPNTYVCMKGFDVDSDTIAQTKIESMPARVDYIATKILEESREADVVRGGWSWAKSHIVYPWFRRFAMSPKPFHVLDSCISCGLCSRECPLGNIAIDETGHPQWGDDCALCLRCYHFCPTNAVAYGKATRGKGQYHYDAHQNDKN